MLVGSKHQTLHTTSIYTVSFVVSSYLISLTNIKHPMCVPEHTRMRREVGVFIWGSNQREPPLATPAPAPPSGTLRPVLRKGMEMTFLVCVTVSVSCATKCPSSCGWGPNDRLSFNSFSVFLGHLLLTRAPHFIFSPCPLV